MKNFILGSLSTIVFSMLGYGIIKGLTYKGVIKWYMFQNIIMIIVSIFIIPILFVCTTINLATIPPYPTKTTILNQAIYIMRVLLHFLIIPFYLFVLILVV